ncbi:MAG: hypothetical protein JXA66_04565, partial [Oligoflexia bacterium]|nr:hypothetical protein [Oligoflexia bacterium]
LVRDYDNLKRSDAYSTARYCLYDLIHKTNIHRSVYDGMAENIGIEDIRHFARGLFRKIQVEAYAYGHISSEAVTGLVDYIYSAFGSDKISGQDLPADLIFRYPVGRPSARVVKSNSGDSCWAAFIQFGDRSTRLSAVIQTGMAFMSPYFFEELRNREQIGYVVESRLDFFEKVLGITFTVLSDRHDPFYISERVRRVFDRFPGYLESLPGQQFEEARKSLINKIRKRNRTLDDWMAELILTAVLKGDHTYGDELAKMIERLKLTEISETFKKALAPRTMASVSVYVTPSNAYKLPEFEEMITDLDSFKRTTPVY